MSVSTAPKLATRRRGTTGAGSICACCWSGGLAGKAWVVDAGEVEVVEHAPSDDARRSPGMGAASEEAALGVNEVEVDVLAEGDDHGYGLVLSAGEDAIELGRRPPRAMEDRLGCM